VSLLLRVVFTSVCRTTHHRLAVDALRHVRLPESERWIDLFLQQHGELLAGSMAPDERFGDFRNHVVHVAEKNWGGAPQQARLWYGRLVDALRRREWPETAYAAGVLSHYLSDPFMPLHTARSEEDTSVHGPIEYCIGKSYGLLQQIIVHELGGYPQLETPRAGEWLESMVLIGAELAHEHYAAVLQHFDLERAARDPLSGMDAECQQRIAICLGHAVVAVSRVLERAVMESEVEAPSTETTLHGFTAAIAAPLRWLRQQCGDLGERMALEAMLDESRHTGKVVKNLRISDREVRRSHAEEVLKLPLSRLDQQAARLTGTLYGTGQAEFAHHNRLICEIAPGSSDQVSTAWREAQRRAQQRSQSKRLAA
jgi:hypothetical protein